MSNHWDFPQNWLQWLFLPGRIQTWLPTPCRDSGSSWRSIHVSSWTQYKRRGHSYRCTAINFGQHGICNLIYCSSKPSSGCPMSFECHVSIQQERCEKTSSHRPWISKLKALSSSLSSWILSSMVWRTSGLWMRSRQGSWGAGLTLSSGRQILLVQVCWGSKSSLHIGIINEVYSEELQESV